MRHPAYTLLLLILLLLGKNDSLRAQRFDEVWARNPWNETLNRAGLRYDTASEYSYAEVCGGLQRGAYNNHSQSAESYTSGIKTESVRHFKHLSFAGEFAYDYFTGREMWGSLFTSPNSWLVDLYEYTPGRKVRESYAFEGILAADLGKEWSGALDVDFAAGNYAKRKDLRHKNTTLDIEVTPALAWHHGKWSAGAAYRFEKRSERIEAEEVGSTPDSYVAFIDKGLYYGIETLWTSGDLHLNEAGISAFPIRETLHGAALQLQYGELIGEASYHYRSGESGEKGTVWHTFEGNGFDALLRWHHHSTNGGLHILRGRIGWQEQQNSEEILSTETEGGVTLTQSYGSVPIFEERTLQSLVAYEWQYNGSHIEAGAAYKLRRRQSSLLYPLLQAQSLRTWELHARGRKGWQHVELTFGARFAWGSHVEWEDREGNLQPDTRYPLQQSELFAWENEYLTARRLGLEIALRIHLGKGFYTDLAALWEHGFRLQTIPQPNRIEATLCIGYKW